MNLTIHIYIPTSEGYVQLEEATAAQKEAQGAKLLKAVGKILCEGE